MEAQRELLDALMGKGRNRSKEDAPLKQQHWDDSDVCPYYLCAFCPNDLFVNTKSDLGQCEFYHVDELKQEYNKQPRRVQRKIEKKLLQYLYELVSDVDRRIRRGKERIALNAPSTQPNPIIEQQIEQKKKSISLRCAQLDAEINKLKEHIEILCNQGKIDDAEAMLSQVETLEADKDNLQNMDVNHVGIKDPRSDKNRFQICEICGVFQAVDDAEDRIARHFEGKQHKGFAIIRDKIKEFEALHIKELNKINDYKGRDRRERDRHRNRDRNRREREREREKSNDRRRKDRHKDRDRDKDKDKRKSRNSRDRDRDRGRHKDKYYNNNNSSGSSNRRSDKYHSSNYNNNNNNNNNNNKYDEKDRKERERDRDRRKDRDRDRKRDKDKRRSKSKERSRSRDRNKDIGIKDKRKRDSKETDIINEKNDIEMMDKSNGKRNDNIKWNEIEEGETK